MFNKIIHFLNFQIILSGDFLWASDHKVPIQDYGDIDVEIQSLINKRLMRLCDVIFYKNFAVNLILLCHLYKIGYW